MNTYRLSADPNNHLGRIEIVSPNDECLARRTIHSLSEINGVLDDLQVLISFLPAQRDTIAFLLARANVPLSL